MLTGDENIVDVDFVVQWRIRDAGAYLFNIRAPEQTVKLAAESAMREVVGQNTLDFVKLLAKQLKLFCRIFSIVTGRALVYLKSVFKVQTPRRK